MSDSQQVTELSSEQRVRAAVPDARFAEVTASRWWKIVAKRTNHAWRLEELSGPFLSMQNGSAWNSALLHPRVQAYEALHRPKAVAQHEPLEWGTACPNAPDRGPHECSGGGACGLAHVCLRCGNGHLPDPVAHREGGEEPTLIGMSESYVESNFQECEKCGGSGLEPYPAAKPVPPASGFEDEWMNGATGKVFASFASRTDPPEFYRAVAHVAYCAALSMHPPAPPTLTPATDEEVALIAKAQGKNDHSVADVLFAFVNLRNTHPPAPVDAKVTWRVEGEFPNFGEPVWYVLQGGDDEQSARNLYVAPSDHDGIIPKRLVKITTTEEVIETRKKE